MSPYCAENNSYIDDKIISYHSFSFCRLSLSKVNALNPFLIALIPAFPIPTAPLPTANPIPAASPRHRPAETPLAPLPSNIAVFARVSLRICTLFPQE